MPSALPCLPLQVEGSQNMIRIVGLSHTCVSRFFSCLFPTPPSPQVESSQSMIRIVGLSATLPNYRDVARFLGVNNDSGK